MTRTQSLRPDVFPKRRRRWITGAAAEEYKLPILLTIAHLPLGIALYNAGSLALIHPFIVFALGLRAAWSRHVKLDTVAMYVAYLVGSEILWRMARLPIFWESGKYVSALILIIALVRRGKWHIPPLPLLYFLFLIPACLMTLFNREFVVARQMISFGMSGPFLAFVACWFCSHLKIGWTQIKKIIIALIVPLSSVAVTTLFYTVTAEEIVFNTESNKTTSGGFGPNQVSAMLGLGVFLCIFCYLIFRKKFTETLYLVFFMVMFSAQSLMTFSRGGMYNALGAAAAAAIVYLLLSPGEGVKRILPVAIVSLIFLALLFPMLNDFTGGNLEARFRETDLTNRGSIAEADFEIFAEHPLFGVGVGQSYFEYEKILEEGAASHTEFSRLLSEHGFFGIFSLAALIFMCASNFMRQQTGAGKAFVVGLVVWSSLFMFNAGMRLAAPAFILGLSCTQLGQGFTRKRKLDKKNLSS